MTNEQEETENTTAYEDFETFRMSQLPEGFVAPTREDSLAEEALDRAFDSDEMNDWNRASDSLIREIEGF